MRQVLKLVLEDVSSKQMCHLVGGASLEQLEDGLVAVEAINDGLGVGNSLLHDTHDEVFAKG